MSIEGFYRLFECADLEVVSISTADLLDVDIIRNAYLKNPVSFSGNHFVRQLMADTNHSE